MNTIGHTQTHTSALSVFLRLDRLCYKKKNEIRINNVILRVHPIDGKRFNRLGDGPIYMVGSRGYTSADRVALLAGHCTLYNVRPHLCKKLVFFIRPFSASRQIPEKRTQIINVGEKNVCYSQRALCTHVPHDISVQEKL